MARRRIPAWQSAPLIALLSALGAFATALPRSLEVRLGRILGYLVFRARLFKRAVVESNVRLCFPDLDERSRLAMVRRNYEHYGILLFEFMHFFSPFARHWGSYVPRAARVEGRENWERAHARGNGVIFFCSHLGCWETGAAAVALTGIPATIVTTVLQPDWLHRKITDARASVGMAAAFHPGSMPSVVKTLRRGGSVAFMNDQYACPPMGLLATFFGMRVDTLSVVGPLAKRTGAAVLPLHTFRAPDGTTIARIEPEMDFGADADDAAATTQAITTRVERWVREHPEQWLWMHRRFKNARPAEAVS